VDAREGRLKVSEVTREAIQRAILPEVLGLLRRYAGDEDRTAEALADYAAALALKAGWTSGQSLVELTRGGNP